MTDAEVNVCVDALWDNAIDGRFADRHLDSDFDKAEAMLKASFVAWLLSKVSSE